MTRFLLGLFLGALLDFDGLGFVFLSLAFAALVGASLWLVTLPFRWAWRNRERRDGVTVAR